MNRHARRAAAAGKRKPAPAYMDLRACTPENLAKASVIADQAGQPGVAELLREVRRGGLALFNLSHRELPITVDDLSLAMRPTVVVVGDDDYQTTGPSGWTGAPALTEWAAAAVIHATGASAESYREAAKAARLLGRSVLIETNTMYAGEWALRFEGRPCLLVLPREGSHPTLPRREMMQ